MSVSLITYYNRKSARCREATNIPILNTEASGFNDLNPDYSQDTRKKPSVHSDVFCRCTLRLFIHTWHYTPHYMWHFLVTGTSFVLHRDCVWFCVTPVLAGETAVIYRLPAYRYSLLSHHQQFTSNDTQSRCQPIPKQAAASHLQYFLLFMLR